MNSIHQASMNPSGSGVLLSSSGELEAVARAPVRVPKAEIVWNGFDASLRLGIGAAATLIILLGWDSVLHDLDFLIKLLLVTIASYGVFEPVLSRAFWCEQLHSVSPNLRVRQRIRPLASAAFLALLPIAVLVVESQCMRFHSIAREN